ncbi:MAG: sugar phosphate isomerase/epimerase [Candidatus Latescibacteria bacterium]|jgi:sugar phosphate isomerase/epimerase|nr:sugar phosphate isomerase/epimerase [Candidatus Latescibacterota bacterium]
MPEKLTRRKALAVGAASAGTLIGTSYSISAQDKSKKSPLPFLTPWSPPVDLERELTPGTTPVRLACSAYPMHYSDNINITETVKRVRDMGYTAAMGGGHDWLSAPESAIIELKKALKTYDVIIAEMHICANNLHPDLSERRENQRLVAKTVESAERVGASEVTVCLGSRSRFGTTRTHRDNWTTETWKASVKAVRQIISDTAGMKVKLGMEALNLSPLNNPRAHLKLMEDVGDSRCKVCLDPQNMLNITTYYRTTELLDECFDVLGENILACHGKDVLLDPDRMLPKFDWVVHGRGTMDYETYLIRLSRMKYPRSLLLEFLSRDQYPEAKKFVEETAKKAGVTIYS